MKKCSPNSGCVELDAIGIRTSLRFRLGGFDKVCFTPIFTDSPVEGVQVWLGAKNSIIEFDPPRTHATYEELGGVSKFLVDDMRLQMNPTPLKDEPSCKPT